MNLIRAKSKKIPREELQDEINRLKQRVQRFESQTEELLKKNSLLENMNKALREECKSSGYVQMTRKHGDFQEESFYHAVIDVPNIRSLLEGWKIKIKDWEHYLELTKHKSTTVAVIGNYNKGKTFLLGRLSELKTPEGFNVNTQGLSITYLHNPKDGTQLPILGLDTKGSSLPLDISAMSKYNFGDEELFDANLSLKLQNEGLEEKELKDLLRDHEATEDVLQNFIMDIANIILVVVSDLNFEDQKLVNRIKRKFKNAKTKKIIVVHNLYHTHYVIDVEYKINEFIKKAFPLDEIQHKYSDNSQSRTYLVEQLRKDDVIPHIILAKEHSEAGRYYNDVGIKYIRESINTNDQQKPIDIVEKFYKYLQKCLYTYIKADRDLTIDDLRLDIDSLGRYQSIRLNLVKELKLKSVFADELGNLHIFKDGFQPNYALYDEFYSDEERYLCLKLECPEQCAGIKSRIHLTTEEFKIQIKGTKGTSLLGNSEILANTRQFGEFYVETDLYKRSKYKFDYNEIPKIIYVDGMIILKWRLVSSNGDDWISL